MLSLQSLQALTASTGIAETCPLRFAKFKMTRREKTRTQIRQGPQLPVYTGCHDRRDLIAHAHPITDCSTGR